LDLSDDDREPPLNSDTSGTYIDIFQRRMESPLCFTHIPLNKYMHETYDLDYIKKRYQRIQAIPVEF